MKLHDVCDEVATSTVDDNVIKEAIPTKWVHRKKGTGVRCRIVAKGYTEKIEDEDSVYASTPMFTTLQTLLALQMSRPNWVARLGDVSTAFLHAPIAKDNEGKQRDIYLWPPTELCPQQDKQWRLKKAMYGLRSSPKAWQDYLAEALEKLGFVRLKSEQQFLGRNIEHFGNYRTLGLLGSYIRNMLEETGMTNCNSVNTPGIAHYKPTLEDEALLDHVQHKRYRRFNG